MNTGQKGKSFDKLDRDGVAQHRNVMHEIAMKKQISMYQREEKILERELREISKVKDTLLQIRAPLRRRVQAATVEDNFVDGTATERSLRKTLLATRKASVSTSGVQEKSTSEKDIESACASKPQTTSRRPSLQVTTPSPSPQQRKISVDLRTHQNTPQGISGGKTALIQRKISAPTFGSIKTEVSEDYRKSGSFLPVIKTPNPPADCSPSIKRKSPLIDRPLSGEKTDKLVDSRHRPRSSALLTLIAPSRADTMRARSVPCDLPSHLLVKTPRPRKPVNADECASLTMEETLRIKGKFRQIGHSVIATALLKGLKQKGQLSSEAIHNMHKPIALDEASEAKVDEYAENDAAAAEATEDDEGKMMTTGQRRKSFKNLARKTINVNRMIGTAGRRRAQSEPAAEKSGSVNTPSLRPKRSGSSVKHSDKGPLQEKAETTSVQPRRKDSNETQQDSNTQRDESENSSQNQQMYKKHSTEVDPLRPLMNPRTALARRRKNTATGDARDISEQADNTTRDTRPQSSQLDGQTSANKSVRFASDAWT